MQSDNFLNRLANDCPAILLVQSKSTSDIVLYNFIYTINSNRLTVEFSGKTLNASNTAHLPVSGDEAVKAADTKTHEINQTFCKTFKNTCWLAPSMSAHIGLSKLISINDFQLNVDQLEFNDSKRIVSTKNQ